MTITIADGRGALWQWDTGRRCKITDGDGVKQVHYQNKCFGRSVDVDVGDDGTAIIPDELLQDWHTLTAYAYVTDDAGGYTKVQVDFAVHKRARPSDYVYTPTEHAGFDRLRAEIGDLSALQTTAKDNLVAAINEAAASGGADWAQNDPTAKDYVKNRTHWVEMSYEEKYTNDNAPFVDNGFGVIKFTPDSVTWDLVAGDNYSVLFDGNEYRCVCNSASRYGRTWIWAGNAAFGAPYNEFAPNSGEPFLITDSGIIAKSAGNHAIRISRVDVNIHRLPEEFMNLDGVWASIDSATEKANTAIAGTQLVVTQLKLGDINVGETYSAAVKVANGVSTFVPVSGLAYIIACGNESTMKQCIYLNKMLGDVAYTGMFAALNASDDGVGRVYGVYVNVKDAIAKFTRIA